MSTSQIILSVIAALFLLFYIRRWIQKAHMKEYSASEVSERMNDDSVVLLDVRTPEERNHKHIKGSLHIPVNELAQKLKMLEKYRQKEIICYCHSGSRSFMSTILLTKNGFQAANMNRRYDRMEFSQSQIIKWSKRSLHVILGAAVGYASYHFIGCAGGTCPISSNPYISTVYGGIIGVLLIPRAGKSKEGTEIQL